MHVEHDGSDGGAAVIVATGEDAVDDFLNIYGLGGFTVAALSEALRPTLPLHLQVTATYTLAPGDPFIRVDYAIHNEEASAKKVLFGTLSDSGAEIELFHPGVGYGEFTMNQLLLGAVPTVEYLALQGQGITYGLVPVEKDPQARGAPLPIGGVVVEAYEQRTFSDALGPAGQTVAIGGNGTTTRSVWLSAFGAGGAGAVEGFVRAQKQQAHAPVKGTVSGTTRPTGGGARIAISKAGVTDPGAALVTTFVADDAGAFAGELPPGDYVAQAEGDAWRRSDAVPFHVAPSTGAPPLSLVLPDRATLSYRVHDDAGAPLPARSPSSARRRTRPIGAFATSSRIRCPTAWPRGRHSRAGDSSLGTAYDHPIALAPGHYRVVVSRGPEWSALRARSSTCRAEGAARRRRRSMRVRRHQRLRRRATSISTRTCRPTRRCRPKIAWSATSPTASSIISSTSTTCTSTIARSSTRSAPATSSTVGVGVESTPFDYGHFIG